MQQFQPASFLSSVPFQRSRPAVLIALIVLTLGIAACSRQADGPFEPVDGSTPTLQSTPVSQSVDGTVVAGSDFTGSTAGTLPPLPTEEAGDDTVGGDASGSDLGERSTEEADAVAVFTLDPNAPPIFTLAASATWTAAPDNGEGSATEDVTPTLSGNFITPGAPIGPVDLSGAGSNGTAEAGGGAGDLLPTPTDLLDFGNDDSDTVDVDEECIYVVQSGDSLFSISLDLEVALDDLRAINPEVQDTDVIQVDQELIIPDCDEDFVVSTDEVDEEDSIPTPDSSTDDSSTGTGRTHMVAAGETLFIIAQEYDVTIDAIVEANSLTNPNQLDIGQVLVIPDTE